MTRVLLMLLTLLPLPGTPPPRPEVAATSVLSAWDAARASAWADGRPRELCPLYTPDSVAGRHDRAMLRAWHRRGLVVDGLELQLLSVTSLRRTPTRWLLSVVDRVAGGTVIGPGLWQPLPVDAATRHVVLLRLVEGAWRVAGVRSAG